MEMHHRQRLQYPGRKSGPTGGPTAALLPAPAPGSSRYPGRMALRPGPANGNNPAQTHPPKQVETPAHTRTGIAVGGRIEKPPHGN